jgi:hypothetical protein
VSGTQPQIEVIKPFSDAFPLTKRILFQPFDLKKWFVIGFGAWLSHLGASFNYNYNGRSDWRNMPAFQGIRDFIDQIPSWVLVSGIAILISFICAFVIVCTWLRARGRFMFIDCLVKNRGAIIEPWREFRSEGNSYFFFALVTGLIVALVVGLAGLPFLIPIVRGMPFTEHTFYLISVIVVWAVVFVVLVFGWTVISHFMIPVMYRRRCRASEGFRIAATLIVDYPGEITLYCLFWIVIGIASMIVACATILATCCIALIPYIGTVIMLPIFVCLRAFGLLFIRQFGTDYDVWTGISEPLTPSVPKPPPLPQT